jgi:hypothetical protein
VRMDRLVLISRSIKSERSGSLIWRDDDESEHHGLWRIDSDRLWVRKLYSW